MALRLTPCLSQQTQKFILCNYVDEPKERSGYSHFPCQFIPCEAFFDFAAMTATLSVASTKTYDAATIRFTAHDTVSP